MREHTTLRVTSGRDRGYPRTGSRTCGVARLVSHTIRICTTLAGNPAGKSVPAPCRTVLCAHGITAVSPSSRPVGDLRDHHQMSVGNAESTVPTHSPGSTAQSAKAQTSWVRERARVRLQAACAIAWVRLGTLRHQACLAWCGIGLAHGLRQRARSIPTTRSAPRYASLDQHRQRSSSRR